MLIIKLAYKNLVGAGLKTWLKVAVLSFTYVLITWHFGLLSGMYNSAKTAMIKDEIAGGQFWHENYDPYDPFTLDDSHGKITGQLETMVRTNNAAAILIRQASIYPEGRVQSVLIKGINPGQQAVEMPTAALATGKDILPVLIGRRMARSNSIKLNDFITIRWRDINGTFDAIEGQVIEIMKTQVPTLDSRQVWVPLDRLQRMTGLDNEATIITVNQAAKEQTDTGQWKFKDMKYLTKELDAMIQSKWTGAAVMYSILVLLAMIAIFDTQILSIFRRRKEIGTLMALGLKRAGVVVLFTLEGALIGVLAAAVGAVYGAPLLYITATKGIGFPEMVEDYGFAIASKLYPVYTGRLILVTLALIMVVTTVVSYLPTRKIAKLNPTEALKGKIS